MCRPTIVATAHPAQWGNNHRSCSVQWGQKSPIVWPPLRPLLPLSSGGQADKIKTITLTTMRGVQLFKCTRRGLFERALFDIFGVVVVAFVVLFRDMFRGPMWPSIDWLHVRALTDRGAVREASWQSLGQVFVFCWLFVFGQVFFFVGFLSLGARPADSVAPPRARCARVPT